MGREVGCLEDGSWKLDVWKMEDGEICAKRVWITKPIAPDCNGILFCDCVGKVQKCYSAPFAISKKI